MSKRIGLMLCLLCLGELAGCSTIKWMYSDKATGEMWWIKQSPLGADEINYCQPQTSAPTQCFTAELLDAPPAAWPSTRQP